MKTNTRITAGIMALMLVFGAGTAVVHTKFSVHDSVVATSAETLQYGSLSYEVLDNGTITITGFDDSVTEVEIPSEIEGKPVTAIGSDAFSYKKIKSVTIPDGVTSIGDFAFNSCSSLTSVTIPDSVKSIGNYAFYRCIALTSVTILDGVTSIGDFAFYNCNGLTSVTIPDSVKSIGNSAFASCKALTSVTIPDGVTSIGDFAFNDCRNITSITIPESITNICKATFWRCSKLKSVTLLNPDCEIYNDPFALGDKSVTTIYGYENSTAQAYAEKYGYTFSAIGTISTTQTTTTSDNTTTTTTTISGNTATDKKGDINGDGKVNAVDASIISSYYVYLSTTEDEPVMDIDEFQAVQE